MNLAYFMEEMFLSSPTFIALIGGIIAALVVGGNERHARLVVLGCLILIGVNLLAIYWIVTGAFGNDRGNLRLGLSLLEAFGFFLLILAALSGRISARYRRFLELFREDEDERSPLSPPGERGRG